MNKRIQGGKPQNSTTTNQFPTGYDPNLDTIVELEEDQATYYQSQIGILHLIVELERIDIWQQMYNFWHHMLHSQEKGHLQTLFHIYAYLNKRHKSRLALDPLYPRIDMTTFLQAGWTDFYGGVKEALPDSTPEPRGKPIIVRDFVYSDHANDKVRQRSQMRFCFLINIACIIQYTKRQATVENAIFCAEFVAVRQAMVVSRGLRYMLRIMGILRDRPTHMYGDNMSTIHNTQHPGSQLNKKSNSICHHAVREAVLMGELLTGLVMRDENPADILTKVVGGTQKRLTENAV